MSVSAWNANATTGATRPLIRDASAADLPALRDILNDEILTSTSSWTTTAKSPDDMSAWFAERRSGGFPVLVAENVGEIDGYASYGPFRKGEGYAGVVEHTVYVARPARRRGIARMLMERLIARARSEGVRVMIGGISGDAAPSIALHEALGFERMAHLPQIGRKFGRDLDLILMALRL